MSVWDFCIANNGKFYGVVTMNAKFFSDYVRNIYGENRYFVINEYLPQGIAWAAIIYDWTTSEWEELYESAPDAGCQGASPIPCGDAWDDFESHYPVGNTCSTVPTMSSAELYLGSSLVSPSVSYADSEGNCFTGIPFPYTWDLVDANYYWNVTGGS